MLKDIVERPSKPPTAPSAPQPPTPGGSGFPAAMHRSQRPSAFARARQQQQAKQDGKRVLGQGKAVDIVPSLTASSDVAQRAGGLPSGSEGDQVRQSVAAGNIQRVEGMSQLEREEEVAELQQRFDGGVLEALKKRAVGRIDRTPEEGVSSEVVESGPSQPRTTGLQSVDQALSDPQRIIQDVSEENRKRVEAMSGMEREEEVEELQERFGARIMEALRKRAEKRVAGSDKRSEETRKPTAQVSAPHPNQPTPQVRSTADDPSLSDLKAYFPSVPSEPSKLAWLQPIPTSVPSSSSATRFDLSGNVLSATAQADLPSHLGLHHHGSSPDLAGYTMHDVLYLCRSTVPSQRIAMMTVLTRIVSKLRRDSLPEETAKECEQTEVLKRAVEMGVDVLAGLTRGIGVIEAGVELLYEAIGLSEDDQQAILRAASDQHTMPRRFTPDSEDEKAGVSSIPFEDVLPRMTELLSIDDGLSPQTIQQLLLILRRATFVSKELCETICPILPAIIQHHVVQRSWPPKSDKGRYPSVEALRLLTSITTSSRACAEELLSQGVYESTLRFIVTATWESKDAEHDYYVYHGQQLALQVLRVYAALGRYGLAASTVTSSSQIWRMLGTWVNGSVRRTITSAMERHLVVAYFECLSIWTTCAIDPHRTTPEHSLTWAQVTAMRWEEDVIGFVVSLELDVTRRGEICAALGMLGSWLRGVRVNGVRGGEEEKAAVLDRLKGARLGEAIGSVADHDRRSDGELVCAEVLQVHDLLSPAGDLLDPASLQTCRSALRSSNATMLNRRATLTGLYHSLQIDMRSSAITTWLPTAFDLFTHFDIGDEPLALDLLDSILRAELTGVIPKLDALPHPDKLELLRPLLQHTILPDVESTVGPLRPSHLYLKATSTLRPPAPRSSDEKAQGAGLPLQPDWTFSPLNELLRSGTSVALAQVPPDWQASEVQIVLATLLLSSMRYRHAPLGPQERSHLLLNLMKVHMLEHGQTTSNAADEVEVFRDPAVREVMRELMALTTSSAGLSESVTDASPSDTVEAGSASHAAPLERVSIPFLGSGVPFYQFYLDFVALYEAISFSDPLFSQLLITPLSMAYPPDYRRAVWNDRSSVLRGIRLSLDQLPLETVSAPRAYFDPLEDDPEVLSAYARALTNGWVDPARNPFLYSVASHHIAGLLWNGQDENRQSLRVGLLVSVLSTGSDALLRALLYWNADRLGSPATGDISANLDIEEVTRRKALVSKLAGPRGAERVEAI
ncbi:hypothetical protein IAU60_005926 [Kwoniella sp. DSM 27419]